MNARITLLGTGSAELNPLRAGQSALVQLEPPKGESLNLVYDFGSRVADRLHALGLRQNDVQHIVVSHRHPDHSIGLLTYLHAACWDRRDSRTTPLTIYAKPETADLLERLLSVFGERELHLPENFSLMIERVMGTCIEIQGQRFEFTSLPEHGNHGISFNVGGRKICLSGDAYCTPELVAFVKDASIAVLDFGHQGEERIVKVLAEGNPELAVLSHFNGELPNIESLAARAKAAGFRGEVRIGNDFDVFTV